MWVRLRDEFLALALERAALCGELRQGSVLLQALPETQQVALLFPATSTFGVAVFAGASALADCSLAQCFLFNSRSVSRRSSIFPGFRCLAGIGRGWRGGLTLTSLQPCFLVRAASMASAKLYAFDATTSAQLVSS